MLPLLPVLLFVSNGVARSRATLHRMISLNEPTPLTGDRQEINKVAPSPWQKISVGKNNNEHSTTSIGYRLFRPYYMNLSSLALSLDTRLGYIMNVFHPFTVYLEFLAKRNRAHSSRWLRDSRSRTIGDHISSILRCTICIGIAGDTPAVVVVVVVVVAGRRVRRRRRRGGRRRRVCGHSPTAAIAHFPLDSSR